MFLHLNHTIVKKNLKLTIILLLGFLIIREVLPIDIHAYKSYKKLYTSPNQSNQSSSLFMDDSEIYSAFIEALQESDSSQFGSDSIVQKLKNIREAVLNMGGVINLDQSPDYSFEFPTLENNVSEMDSIDNVFTIHVQTNRDISLARYLPLIKPVGFRSEASYFYSERVQKNGKIHTLNGNGSIVVSGTYEVYGLCAGRHITAFIQKEVDEQIVRSAIQSVVEKVKSLDSNLPPSSLPGK